MDIQQYAVIFSFITFNCPSINSKLQIFYPNKLKLKTNTANAGAVRTIEFNGSLKEKLKNLYMKDSLEKIKDTSFKAH